MQVDSSGGIAYTIDIYVGEGKVAVPVLVDTGSADIWVSASPCKNCTDAKMVDTKITSTDGCKLVSKGYGSGSVDGCLVSTDVSLGRYSLSNYPILAARDMRGFDGKYMSGILGLAMRNMALSNQSPIDLLFSSGIISSAEVGFYLARDGDESELVLGNPHDSHHADQTKKVQLSKKGSDGLYRVNLESFVSHGQPINSEGANLQSIEVIIDTGTTNILLPEHMLEPIYNALKGHKDVNQNYWVAPCKRPNDANELLGLNFGGTVFNLKWEDLVIASSSSKSQYCPLRIQNTPADDYLLIGSAFLHNVYHVVNVDSGEITFYGLTDA
ncbi:uncharacterized protein IL334_007103 [Kwoniella shivajii]|uniref:Peptidase A1 domain-containing protein n=1 Tax=Kwoniella shivajii TaxID=564305 RepID=A0ABZ1D9L3_9TREE|nr:hypothetical protein IL334_007103 [Kwoniella shivajii]